MLPIITYEIELHGGPDAGLPPQHTITKKFGLKDQPLGGHGRELRQTLAGFYQRICITACQKKYCAFGVVRVRVDEGAGLC